MGKPIVACTGTGGPDDLHKLGDCVALVPPKDVDHLTITLQTLIENPDRRQEMGRIGQQIVQQYFTWARNAAATLAIYEEVMV